MATPPTVAVPQSLSLERSGDTDRRRWAIVVLLGIGAVIAFCSRTNISVALTHQPFVQRFHLTDFERGQLNSAFFWAYMLLQIPTGWLVDRYGAKFPYAISFAFWCVASALTGMAQSAAQLASLRFATGAGEAIVTPASFSWMRQHFSENQSGLAIGIYMLGTKLGPAFGTSLAAWLITLYDWRLMFLIMGLVGLIWLIPWLLMVKNDRPSTRADKGKPKVSMPFRNIMASPVVWGSIIINFCYSYFVFYCMTWMPAYFHEQRHVSLNKMGLYSFFTFGGIAIVAVAAGWAADWMIKRGGDPVRVRKAFVIAGFAIACTEMLGVLSPSVRGALFWAIVSLSGLGLTTANSLALCRMTLIPREGIGLVTGVQNVSTSFAGIVASDLTGWLLQVSGSYWAPMMAIFVVLALGALSCLILLRREWSPKVNIAPATAT